MRRRLNVCHYAVPDQSSPKLSPISKRSTRIRSRSAPIRVEQVSCGSQPHSEVARKSGVSNLGSNVLQMICGLSQMTTVIFAFPVTMGTEQSVHVELAGNRLAVSRNPVPLG